MRLTLNRDYETKTDAPHPVQTPEYFPSRVQVRSAKLVTCVTHNGVTSCWGSSARSGHTQGQGHDDLIDFRKTTRIVEDSTAPFADKKL